MTPIPKLSDAQRVLLSRASQHEAGIATPPAIPRLAAEKLVGSLLSKGLLIEIPAPRGHVALTWRRDESGASITLQITAAGLHAIGMEPNDTNAVDAAERGGLTEAEYEEVQALAQEALDAGIDLRADAEEGTRPRHEQNGVDEALIYGPAAEWQQPAGDEALLEQALAEGTPRGLKAAAKAVLAAWDSARPDGADGMARTIERLRIALAGQPARATRRASAPPKPREGTKVMVVLALLRRREGATVAQVCEATCWNKDTVRGFFAGLKKKGIAVEVLERVRAVGPNRAGGRGSYTIYRVTETAKA